VSAVPAGARGEAAPAAVVAGPRLSPGLTVAVREAWSALWTSRLVVWAAGAVSVLWLGVAPGSERFDSGHLVSPFSWLGDVLLAPAARWDAVWYVAIARDGYGHGATSAFQPLSFYPDHAKAVFFPLYPLLTHAVAWLAGPPVVAGIALSLACFFAALVLLHRLAEIELGPQDARGTVLLTAFFPTALFFSAVYTESLFLALSVGAVLAARQGRWAWAGVAGGLAALTRNSGVLLLVPLAILLLYGPRADREPAAGGGAWWRPRHPLTPQALWLALVPAGLALYLAYCAIEFGDALAPLHLERLWFHHTVLLGGVTGGIGAAFRELRQLVQAHGPVPFTGKGSDPVDVAGASVLLLGFLACSLVALAGALRRLPFAYGAYAAVAILLTLSSPIDAQPLEGYSRYILVLFPLHMWLARWTRERGRFDQALAISAVLLGLLTAQFAHWSFVG
jgi:hypothetical protein